MASLWDMLKQAGATYVGGQTAMPGQQSDQQQASDLKAKLQQTGAAAQSAAPGDEAAPPPPPPVPPVLAPEEENNDRPDLVKALKSPKTISPEERLHGAHEAERAAIAPATKPKTEDQLKQEDIAKVARTADFSSQLASQAKQDPEYKQYADTLGKADQAMKDARDAIASDRATAGWLSSLEKINQALATYAAARYGAEKGVDVVGGMKLQPTDWEKIMGGSIQDLKDELDRLHSEKNQALRGQEEVSSAYRARAGQLTSEADKARVEQDQLRREGQLKTGASQVAEAKDITGAELQGQRYEAMKARGATQLSPAAKEEARLAHSDLKDLDKKSAALNKVLGDLNTVDTKQLTNRNALAQTKAKISQTLASAGIDPATAQSETGWLFKSLDVDPAKAKDLISQRLQQLDQQRQGLRSKLTSGGGAASSPAAIPAPGGKHDQKIQDYANQIGQDYETAKKILVGRGYQPQE